MGELIAIVCDDGDRRLPDVARQVLQVLARRAACRRRGKGAESHDALEGYAETLSLVEVSARAILEW